MLPVDPPAGLTPEAWLSRWAKPSILPYWPASSAIALIVVEEAATEEESDSKAFLVTDEADLEQVVQSLRHFPRRLYFRVPRSVIGDEESPSHPD